MKKIAYATCGSLSLVAGILGIFLPVLPTTPFLLLASFCFAKSSQKLNDKFKSSKLYRYYAADFTESRAIPLKKKIAIILQVYVLMGISITFCPVIWVKYALAGWTLFMTYYLFFIMPTKKD